jgi:hypothetical protein
MKKLILILFLTCLQMQLATAKTPTPVSVLTTHGIVYLKFQKFMMGATLEIRDGQGELVTEEIITRKKIIVDFFYRKMGCYEITIKKGDVNQSFSVDNDEATAPEHIAHIANHKHRDKVLVVQ